jgi:hypothetical protein
MYKSRFSVGAIGAVLLALSTGVMPAAFADEAGKVLGIKGEVVATGASGERVLLKDDAVFEGETVSTGANSYVIIDFIDGAKATVRPNSRITIESYRLGGAENGALLDLVKGGLRAVTGEIAQRQPESYKVKTPVATLGVRGTEYYLRICEQDCADEQAVYVQNMFEQDNL